LSSDVEEPARIDDVDVTKLLDPELRSTFDSFELPPIHSAGLAALRKAALAVAPPSGAVIATEHVVPGNPPVAIRVHRASGAEGQLGAVISLHGGGFVAGSYAMDSPMFDRWCPNLKVVGVAVDYRLAPETTFPGPLEDCYAALGWVHEHAASLGIDPDCIGLYGLSAGGGLAASLAQLARDRGEFPVAFQLLDCPMLDDRQSTSSICAEGLYIWSRESNEFGWRSYLGDHYGSEDMPTYAVPGRASDLARLPPTCIVVGSIDGFRDEDVNFAQRLNQAGVPCELHVLAGMPHGYDLAHNSGVVQQATRDKDSWLSRQLSQLG
jgi:acetyl esterase/lipase